MRNMKIGRRLALAFGAVLVILALSVAAGIWRLQELAATTRQLATVDNEKLQMAEQWRQTIELNWVRTRAAALEDDGSRVTTWQADVDRTSELTTASRNRLVALVTHEESKALIARIDVAREAYRSLRAALFKRRAAGEDVTASLENDVRPLAESYIGSIRSFEDRQRVIYEDSLAQAERNAEHGQRILLGSGLAALLLGTFFAIALTRSIVSPMQLAASTAQRVSDGDLSHRIVVHGRDEAAALMGALQHMQISLNKVVAVVRSKAQEVATASSQIAAGNNDLSARTEQQASALQETAASMEEFSATVRHNAENAQQANQLALAATAIAEKGGAAVARVVATMEDINDSSGRIGDIISVIEGIAFQTNILALNAAVEAARAGDQGRGFAVVAAEVRSLAQRSAQAAKEIKALIDASVERVGVGTSLVAEAGRTMEDVVVSIQRVTSIMGEISAASREQSAGVAQVGDAVIQMDQATQQNAALVEQGAAAAAGLQAQARQLVESVAIFKLVPAEQATA